MFNLGSPADSHRRPKSAMEAANSYEPRITQDILSPLDVRTVFCETYVSPENQPLIKSIKVNKSLMAEFANAKPDSVIKVTTYTEEGSTEVGKFIPREWLGPDGRKYAVLIMADLDSSPLVPGTPIAAAGRKGSKN